MHNFDAELIAGTARFGPSSREEVAPRSISDALQRLPAVIDDPRLLWRLGFRSNALYPADHPRQHQS